MRKPWLGSLLLALLFVGSSHAQAVCELASGTVNGQAREWVTCPTSTIPSTVTLNASGGTQSDAVIATYTAITGLSFTAAANTNYQMTCWIVYTSTAATTGINFAWDVPAGATSIHMDGFTKTVATGANEGFSQNSDNVGTATSASVVTQENLAFLTAIFRNGNTSGTTSLGFTPETANSVSVIGSRSTCLYRIF